MVVETALYERLGVTHDASDDQIRRSYRKAALLWHPDRNRDNPEAAEKFKACLEAYEILSNPNQRILYDTYGLSGVFRTASPSEPAPQTQPTQPQPSASQRQSRRSRPRPTSFFDDDDDFFFSSPFPSQTQQPRSTQTQTQSQSSGSNPRFSFSASWSFTTSSSGGDGSYTTHYQSWNSRDGHQSRRSSGTFGPGSHTINSGSRSNRRSYHQQQQQQEQPQQQQQQATTRNDSSSMRRAQEMPDMQDLFTHDMQNMQNMHNQFHSGGGLFGFNPFGNMGGGFGGLFNSMSNDFPNFFGSNMFGAPNQNGDSSGRQQTNRQYRQR
ncbi:hypothetical protein SEUCBS139899_008635 [Sporothrix eucalyptigena]|uniref:J domain-containing protein n=1 Tax=Sporothrix eucalyptigena TaxID=1812306 RepID=A0ABP0BAN6_9PEZI